MSLGWLLIGNRHFVRHYPEVDRSGSGLLSDPVIPHSAAARNRRGTIASEPPSRTSAPSLMTRICYLHMHWQRPRPPMSFFHCSSSSLEPGSIIKAGNWGRIIRAYGWAHNLAFREAVFDYVRATEFPDRPSRMVCSFFFDSEAEARFYIGADQGRLMMIVYEVSLVLPHAPQHGADWRGVTPVGPIDLEWIKDYWRGIMRPPAQDGIACREILAVTEAVAELRPDVADGALCVCCFPVGAPCGGVIPSCLMAG